jgi:hypothetical protein
MSDSKNLENKERKILGRNPTQLLLCCLCSSLWIGLCTYISFYIGPLFSPSIVFIFAGIGNSLIGVYFL